MIFLALGPLEFSQYGRPRPIGGPRQQRLLALFLINANRAVSMEQLVDDLWDEPPDSVRQQIHNAIAALRRTLADVADSVAIVTTEAGYRLEIAEGLIDTYRFQDLISRAHVARSQSDPGLATTLLRSALDLWRGDAFHGMSGSPIVAAATKLNELRLEAAETMYELQLDAGASGSIVGELQQLVLENPFHESFRVQLMVALARSGRQGDALSIYDDGRKILANELGIDPSPRLTKLYAEILAGNADEVRSTNEHAAPAGPEASPQSVVESGRTVDRYRTQRNCFLPNDTTDFSGRNAEFSELLGDVRQDQATALLISAIDGMGGVGKTTLAVKLAHHLAADYPDGQYFLDLQGFTSGMSPVSAERALDVLLRNSGVPAEVIPPDIAVRQSMWRAEMAGKRAIVVLDNASNPDQVRSVLPGTPGILVIVTSRRKMTALDGASSISLDLFSVQDGVTLFRKIAGGDRIDDDLPAVEAAVRLCGRLPLAIRIAAARMRDRESWTIRDLVERLKNQARRTRLLGLGDRNVMAALRVSYRYLGTAEQQLFRLLTVHPGADFDVYTASALLGVAPSIAEDMLETLLDDNLLRQDVAGRYYFHDLVRDCAFQLCCEIDEEQVVGAAQEALLSYYLHAARNWCHGLAGGEFRNDPLVGSEPAFIRPSGSNEESVEILATEYANISAIIHLGVTHRRFRYVWQLGATILPYLRLRNYDGESRQLIQLGVRAAREDGSARGEAICLRGLAIACQVNGAHQDARLFLDQSAQVSQEIGDVVGYTTSLALTGDLYFARDELQSAYKSFSMADEIAAREPDYDARSRILNNLGVVSRDLGKMADALTYFERAVELERAGRGLTNLICVMRWNAGLTLYLDSRMKDADQVFCQVLDVSLGAKFDRGEALAYVGLANVSRSCGDLDSALRYGRRALGIARDSGLHHIECEALAVLGETSTNRRYFDRAEEIYERLNEYSVRFGLPRYAARAYEGKAHIAWYAGRIEEADQCWRHALELYTDGMVYRKHPLKHLSDIQNEEIKCIWCGTLSETA